MKITLKIATRDEDTNRRIGSYVWEYTPTLENAKEWAACTEKFTYVQDRLDCATVEETDRVIGDIEDEFLKLLGTDLAREINEGIVKL
jgi:hypothetical protein